MSLLRNVCFQSYKKYHRTFKLYNLRFSSVDSSPSGEEKLSSILRTTFPKAKTIHVEDISGGCGAMYAISVISSEFKGKNILNQHRMVTEALKAEVKDMHGLRIHTAIAQNGT